MKKGLILALMTVVTVGLTLPVAAEAPVILTLPIIVITNADAADQGDTTLKTVFRYLNALDLESRVDWRNETYQPIAYRLYWTDLTDTSGIDYLVGHELGWTDALTASEMDGLALGTEPSGKDVYQPAGGYLNLLNANALTTTVMASRPLTPLFPNSIVDVIGLDYNPSTTSPGLPPNDTGMNFLKSWTSGDPLHQTALTDPATELTVIAAVTSGTTQVRASAPETLQVYSLPTEAADGVIEPGGPGGMYKYYTSDPYGKWNRVANPIESNWVKPPTFADPTGKVGFTVDATENPAGKIIFASWNLGLDATGPTLFPMPGNSTDVPATKLYEAELRMRCDAASANLCPGYRFEFTNIGYTSFGGVEVSTSDAANAPYADHDFWVTLLWEVPYGCLDMGETGMMADWPLNPGTDYRDYTLLFDLFHNQYLDYGVMTVEEVRVQAIDKPTASTTPAPLVYSNYSSWVAALLSASDPYFKDGTVTNTATNITMVTGSFDTTGVTGARFAGAFPPVSIVPGDLAGNLACLNNRIVSSSCTAVSSNIETTPITRLYLQPQMSNPVGTWPNLQMTRNTISFTMFGAVDPFAKLITLYGGRITTPSLQPNPGVPPAGAGTTLRHWAYTHGGYNETEDYFVPNIQVWSLNKYPPTGDGSGSGWEDDSGGITISNVTVTYYE